MKRLLVLPLLAACGHGVTLDVPTQAKLTALACDADRLCQADGNLSDENFPLMPHHDAACVNLARTWLQIAGAQCATRELTGTGDPRPTASQQEHWILPGGDTK